MFCQDLCRGNWSWQRQCGFSRFLKFLLWFAVRMLGKITGADQNWNIFPTAQRFLFCTNSILISTLEPFVVHFTTVTEKCLLMLMFKIYCLLFFLHTPDLCTLDINRCRNPYFSYVLYVTTWSIPMAPIPFWPWSLSLLQRRQITPSCWN